MIPPVADPQVSPGERHVYDQCLAEVIERAAAAAESAKPAGYAHSEITLLSPRAHGSASQTLSGKWASRMRSAAAAGRRKVRHTTVHAFKGLESLVVIVTDIGRVDGPSGEALLYTAMTRATEHLAVLAIEDSRPVLASRIMGGPTQ